MNAIPNDKSAVSVLGLDIGGANLKAAHSSGVAITEPFELWKHPDRLSEELRSLSARLPRAEVWAITMTGELCDCFTTKRDGVEHIVSHTVEAAGSGRVMVWQSKGQFATAEAAKVEWMHVAAANWHALATYVSQTLCPDHSGLLIDIGSTTTDLVPLKCGTVAHLATTDTERLMASELVYSGVARTPIAALVRQLPYRDRQVPVAAELFATTLDAYVLLGDLDEDPNSTQTADGRGATKTLAADRIARMVCGDRESTGRDDVLKMATCVANSQLRLLSDALQTVVARTAAPIQTVVTSGMGAFLAARLIDRWEDRPDVVALSSLWSKELADAACAWSTAQLARARL